MTTDQELKLFRALRLILRLQCVLLWRDLRKEVDVDKQTEDAQRELMNEASVFARHDL